MVESYRGEVWRNVARFGGRVGNLGGERSFDRRKGSFYSRECGWCWEIWEVLVEVWAGFE